MLVFSRQESACAVATLALAALTGCGTTYMPARNATFDADGGTQIDDDDIKKAFDARP
jgi:hypothetical protein